MSARGEWEVERTRESPSSRMVKHGTDVIGNKNMKQFEMVLSPEEVQVSKLINSQKIYSYYKGIDSK